MWLAEFCRGFFTLADKYNVQLVGGDTTKGPLSITVSAKGLVKTGKALTRKNAHAGDIICCSGELGNGALGLACKVADLQILNRSFFIDALELTEPRLLLGNLLVDYASSCIDISDGLTQDLAHILVQSQCVAEIAVENLPLSDAMLNEIKYGAISTLQAWEYALTGGDDYELLFTISEEKWALLKPRLQTLGLSCFEIGRVSKVVSDSVDNVQDLISITHQGQLMKLKLAGWDHFK
jgi:thiamine-monophosphate kinase